MDIRVNLNKIIKEKYINLSLVDEGNEIYLIADNGDKEESYLLTIYKDTSEVKLISSADFDFIKEAGFKFDQNGRLIIT